MGTRGPVPKRSEQRRRTNKSEGCHPTVAPASVKVEQPLADELWHPMARDWYESLAMSGQAAFYEPSDWQTARVWAEVLSRQLMADKMSAVMVQAWSGSATELLTTEGARRRARIELERANIDEDEAAAVAQMAAYRDRFGA